MSIELSLTKYFIYIINLYVNELKYTCDSYG